MHYRQMLSLLEKAGLSPEQAAGDLGVSNMTLRRWRSKPERAVLPEMYRRAFEPTVRRLVGEGRLHPEDPDVAAALAPTGDSFQSTLTSLGITHDILNDADKHQTTVVVGLARIGEDENRQAQVKASSKMMARFKAMGAEWKSRVSDLNAVIRSDEITALDKLVAFGALFYLITPFDLIPDAIPVIGYLDDFVILGLAAVYYRKRFPRLFKARKGAPPSKIGNA